MSDEESAILVAMFSAAASATPPESEPEVEGFSDAGAVRFKGAMFELRPWTDSIYLETKEWELKSHFGTNPAQGESHV